MGSCLKRPGGFSGSLLASWGPRGGSHGPSCLRLRLLGSILKSLGGLVAPSWAVLGPSWAVLEPPSEPLTPSWDHHGVFFRGSRGHLGLSWSSLGPPWEPVGPSWAADHRKRHEPDKYRKTKRKSFIFASLEPLGVPLGAALDFVKAILGYLQAVLGRLGAIFEPSRGSGKLIGPHETPPDALGGGHGENLGESQRPWKAERAPGPRISGRGSVPEHLAKVPR